MSDECIHRIMTKQPSLARRLILQHLGIEAHDGGYDTPSGMYAVDFPGPCDVDLDFLRPDILPPKE